MRYKFLLAVSLFSFIIILFTIYMFFINYKIISREEYKICYISDQYNVQIDQDNNSIRNSSIVWEAIKTEWQKKQIFSFKNVLESWNVSDCNNVDDFDKDECKKLLSKCKKTDIECVMQKAEFFQDIQYCNILEWDDLKKCQDFTNVNIIIQKAQFKGDKSICDELWSQELIGICESTFQ